MFVKGALGCSPIGAGVLQVTCIWVVDWIIICGVKHWTDKFDTTMYILENYGPFYNQSQKAKFMEPTWGPPGSCRPQVGPMLASWTLLSGVICWDNSMDKYFQSWVSMGWNFSSMVAASSIIYCDASDDCSLWLIYIFAWFSVCYAWTKFPYPCQLILGSLNQKTSISWCTF